MDAAMPVMSRNQVQGLTDEFTYAIQKSGFTPNDKIRGSQMTEEKM